MPHFYSYSGNSDSDIKRDNSTMTTAADALQSAVESEVLSCDATEGDAELPPLKTSLLRRVLRVTPRI